MRQSHVARPHVAPNAMAGVEAYREPRGEIGVQDASWAIRWGISLHRAREANFSLLARAK